MNAICRSSLHKIIYRNRLDAGSISATLAQHRNVSCAYDLSCYCYPCVDLLKSRIVRILLSCTLPQADNCCPTAFYKNLQCMSSLINVSGALREHHTIESFLRSKFVVFTVVLVIVFAVILIFFYCVFLIIYWSVIFYECSCFLPYCVWKCHNKTVQSINKMIVLPFKFRRSLFVVVQLMIRDSDTGLGAIRRQTIWINEVLVYGRKYLCVTRPRLVKRKSLWNLNYVIISPIDISFVYTPRNNAKISALLTFSTLFFLTIQHTLTHFNMQVVRSCLTS